MSYLRWIYNNTLFLSAKREKNFTKKCKINLTKCKVYFTFTNIEKYPKCKKGEIL